MRALLSRRSGWLLFKAYGLRLKPNAEAQRSAENAEKTNSENWIV
jgi:hypothetical protein